MSRRPSLSAASLRSTPCALPIARCECGLPADPRSKTGDQCRAHWLQDTAIDAFYAAQAAAALLATAVQA